MPELPDRIAMFTKKLAKRKNTLTEPDYLDLGKSTEGYSSDDINKLIMNTFTNVNQKCIEAEFFIKIEDKLY